ncbi:MAG: hypothetical protein E7536_03060 [Ruminococcaceae bacterium]|nr:hypothetical protein [Oscillospiraceae bacterium]
MFYSDVIYQWLDVALDCGINEFDFWNMTIPELQRSINSYNRIKKREAQEKATYDYLLADLIGRSVSRIYSSSNTMPEISEAYPTLFDSEEIKQKKQAKQAELSVLRFKHFANSYNQKFKEVQRVTNE